MYNNKFLSHLFVQGQNALHSTMSLTSDNKKTIHIEKSNQETIKVKMREYSAKKKRSLRDIKSRISLPPELKNSFSFTKQNSSINSHNNNNNNNNNNQQSIQNNNNSTNILKFNQQQLRQRSSYYQTNSLSTQTLNNILNQSNISLVHRSPSQLNTNINGQLSRNEQRLSMLDLGFGKIESYIKLEKLGEGFSLNFVHEYNDVFFVLVLLSYRNICNCLQRKISFVAWLYCVKRNST